MSSADVLVITNMIIPVDWRLCQNAAKPILVVPMFRLERVFEAERTITVIEESETGMTRAIVPPLFQFVASGKGLSTTSRNFQR